VSARRYTMAEIGEAWNASNTGSVAGTSWAAFQVELELQANLQYNGIPYRTEAEWLAEFDARGMRFCTADGADTGGAMWARGLASGALLPYLFVRGKDGADVISDPTVPVEVSYDGEHWRDYDPKRDRGLR
jgi:hypothetical protein